MLLVAEDLSRFISSERFAGSVADMDDTNLWPVIVLFDAEQNAVVHGSPGAAVEHLAYLALKMVRLLFGNGVALRTEVQPPHGFKQSFAHASAKTAPSPSSVRR